MSKLRTTLIATCLAVIATTLPLVGTSSAANAEPALSGSPAATDQPSTARDSAALAGCGITWGPAFWEWEKNRNVLTADAYFTKCTFIRAEARIERSRWYGWEEMAYKRQTGSGNLYLTYNCSGTGKHDFRYRVTVLKYYQNGKPVFAADQYRYIRNKRC